MSVVLRFIGALALFLICLVTSLCVCAQQLQSLSDEQVQRLVQQAQATGMSVEQVEQTALSRGFSSADFDKIRQRVNQLKSTAPPSLSPMTGKNSLETNVVREAPAIPVLPEPVSTQSTVFGASLFTNTNLTFEPNLRIPTPRNYQLGPEDELIIDVYGNAQQTYHPKVSPEGSIRIENLGPIYVNGLTIEQAEQRIVNRLRTLYQDLNSAGSGIRAQVTLGSIRSIRVTLMGQVVRPGTYTLSSLASVFNALYAAGGPSPERGTFRAIKVYRGNRLIRTLDAYDFLLRADQKDNVRLADQDIIFVDHYTTRVELTGEVKQPGTYEVKPDETLQQVLTFAGGFTDRAYTATINLRRNTTTEQQLVTVSGNEITSFLPKPGDRYTVGTILDRVDNKVTIAGAVFRPGEFSLERNTSLKQLIKSAEGLREDAFLNQATIRRLRPNLEPELRSVDIGKLMRGEIPDIPLQRDDRVQIRAVSELQRERTVSIQGAVNKAGSFPFADSMTVANLIVLAGGFSEGAIASRIEIARRITTDTVGLPEGQTTSILTFAIDHNLRLNPADARFTLLPFDQVFVRMSPRYETQKSATIVGEVHFPGVYAIRTSADRITDLLVRAGMAKPDAYLPAARIVRKGENLSVDLRKILVNPADLGNLLVEDGDSIVIPRRAELVRIRGEVLNPAIVEYDPAKSFRDYIAEAGNFTGKAFRRKSYIVAANGKIRPTKSVLGIHRFPKPERGMEIVVPAVPPKEQSKTSSAERAALLGVIASSVAVVLTALRIFAN
ncbi:SLBB domain-containing protein [Spirosoma oryzicola]|uniref:SLBB domain-containing protein n=1 Tax=Spirosoma oryzicola TaxID=2898794 RepID=UPI001E336CF1|nr:SLBB domain-containing protein [Spirosoma oryzicola]UHG92559.1 SLBB domain-containing protein [Spirosoma oryzicola]